MGKEKLESKIKKFGVKIDFEKCKGCELCVYYCPKQVLEISKKSNKKGYFPAKTKRNYKEKCIGCGNCYIICPDCAIEVYKNN